MLGNYKQILEAFCDDINILIGRKEDFGVLGKVVEDFENVSAAIISRNRKCMVLGLGRWKNKAAWPLDLYRLSSRQREFFRILSKLFQDYLTLCTLF